VAFRLRRIDHLAKEVRRVAHQQVDGALAILRGRNPGDPAIVHEIRKRCKKLRAVLRLLRPALGDVYAVENARFRDVARSLSPLRDAHTAVVAYDALLDRYHDEVHRQQFAAVRRRLVRAEECCTGDRSDLGNRYARVRAEMEAARQRIDDWSIADLGVETWRDGFVRAYRRARKAMSAAYDDPTPERFHEWRKAVKHHGYHVDLLRPLWEAQLHARGETVDGLSDLLGWYHDSVVLAAALTERGDGDGAAIGVLRRLIDRRLGEFAVLARPTGMRLFGEKPRRMGARHACYWAAWNEEQQHCRPLNAEQAAAPE